MKNLSAIYNIRNILNNKIYIGSTVNLNKRWYHHKTNLKNNIHHSIILQNTYNKHGLKAFKFEIIEQVNDKNKLLEREQVWLDFFKPEYNICKVAGSSLGKKHSKETLKKISIALKGRTSGMQDKKHSEEAKKRMSIAGKSKIFSNEHKRNISMARKGSKHTEKTKRKISIAQKGKKLSNEHKRKLSIANKGKSHFGSFKKGHKVLEEWKNKAIIANRGNKYCLDRKMSKETRLRISKAHKGKKHTEETKRKMSTTHKKRRVIELI